MSLAVGLGGFWQAFDKGNSAGQRLQNNYRARKNQNEIDALNQQAKNDFNEKVQAGEYNGDQYYEYMMKDVAPKIRDTYLQQGNYDTANNFNTWMESDAGKRRVKLFGQGYAALNNGDHNGVINAAKELATMGGLKDPNGTYIEGKDGNPGFYRLSFSDGEGKRQYQMVPESDFGNWFVNNGNPQAAYEAEIATAKEQRKNSNELTMYQAKKAVDAQYATQSQPKPNLSFGEAVKIVQSSPDSMDLSTDELLDKAKNLSKAAGYTVPGLGGGIAYDSGMQPQQPPQPSGQVIMDTSTGKPAAGFSKENEEDTSQVNNAMIEKKPIIDRAYGIWKSGEYEGKKVPPEYLAGQLAARGITREELPRDMRRSLPQLGYVDRAKNAGQHKGLTNMLDASSDEILQQWQKREPISNDEFDVKDVEEKALELMKNGVEPYKIQLELRNIGTPQRKLISPEFKTLYNRYEESFDYDKTRQNQQQPSSRNIPVGLGQIPIPLQKPIR